MNRCCRWVLSIAVTAGLLLAAAGPVGAQPAARSGAQPVYLALGDLVAAGVGAENRATGYVGQLTGILRKNTVCAPGLTSSGAADRSAAECKQLQLVDLAQGGSTTDSMMKNAAGPSAAVGPRHRAADTANTTATPATTCGS